MATAVIVAGARTPFAKAGTALQDLTARDLGVASVREAVARSGFDPEAIDAVIMGNIASPADASNVTRVIARDAGIPESVPAHTVNRNCASGMEAIIQGARLIAAGEARLVVAGGVESMSGIPLLFGERFKRALFASKRSGSFMGRLSPFLKLRPRDLAPRIALEMGLTDPLCGLNMGETAEVLAGEFGISREMQDALALESHRRAVAASGRLREEMVPVFTRGKGILHEDVGPRPQQTIEALARLRPYFDRTRGSVTAGNSSPITDGAAAVVLASEEMGRGPRIRSWASVGLSPRRMGLGPAYAVPLALDRAGLTLKDVDLVEINEAFAAQVLACVRALDSAEFARRELNRTEAVGALAPETTNVNGGAIALGHPVGASGARLVLTLAAEMRRRGSAVGLATLCVGGGQGSALILEAA